MHLGSHWAIGDYLPISVNVHDPATGVAADADALPSYTVYDTATATALMSGTLAKFDDAGTLGYYLVRIQLTEAAGFVAGRSYNVYIQAAVSGNTVTWSHEFAIGAVATSGVVVPPGANAYSMSQAVADIKRRLLWITQYKSMEPLDGLVDGVNSLFHFANENIVPSSVHLYMPDGTEISPATYTIISAEAGAVRLATPPTEPVYATYTFQAIGDARLAQIARDGFLEMEARYPRGWKLVQDINGEWWISSSASNVVDPLVDAGVTFTQSEANKALYLLCFEYVLHSSQEYEAALNAIDIREDRLSGAAINTTRTAEANQRSLEMLNERIQRALRAVYVGPYGDFIAGARSDEYEAVFDWWSESRQARGVS